MFLDFKILSNLCILTSVFDHMFIRSVTMMHGDINEQGEEEVAADNYKEACVR